MISAIYKFATLFEKFAVGKTLYHGTSIDNIQSIKQHGLIPQVGPWVESAYGCNMELDSDAEEYEGMYDKPIFDVVFAADKAELSKALGGITSSVAHKLNKQFHDVTDEEIQHYGALVVMRDSQQYFERSAPMDRDGDCIGEGTLSEEELSRYPTVEPGDYFSEQVQSSDYILTGQPMIRLFRRYGVWPRLWGPDRKQTEKNKKEYLIKMLQKMRMEFYDEDDNVDYVDSRDKAESVIDSYGIDEIYKLVQSVVADKTFKPHYEK